MKIKHDNEPSFYVFTAGWRERERSFREPDPVRLPIIFDKPSVKLST